MKRTFILLTCMVMAVMSATAQGNKKDDADAIVFTTIKENAITPVKNQNRSGTCWAYASLGYFESEILRKTGQTYDLSEMFGANKDYMDCAVFHIRMHGDSSFSEGGSVTDALEIARNYGL